MASPAISQQAVFAGANKQGHVLDQVSGLVAYGVGHGVALWKPLSASKKGVFSILNGHTQEVTCVKFLGGLDTLVSAGEDGKIIFWKKNGAEEYEHASSVTQKDSSITALAAVDGSILVSGSSLGDISIWRVHPETSEASLVHSFQVKHNFYPTTLCLQKISNNYLLVVGGTSADLFVYYFSGSEESEKDVTLCAVLQGHEDWIKCLSFVTEKEGLDYILASGSQDRYIRLWRLRLNEAIDDSDEDENKLVLLSNKQYKFMLGEDRAAFSFEALIMGHDDWVTDLKWHPSLAADHTHKNGKSGVKTQLLSSSADTALIVWEMDPESGIWVTASRLGELSIKGASTATGSSGGFWCCAWFFDPDSDSQYILASGKTGAIRSYVCTEEGSNVWESVLGVTGPVRAVTDITWSEEGTFFLATSLDQTTRLVAPWSHNRPETEPENGPKNVTWHEFARPQIHGYDMICAAHVSATRFVSGGDEKILRVFEMTEAMNTLLHRFCGVRDLSDGAALPESASLPVLGLSNKAANEQLAAGEAQQRQEDLENDETGKIDKIDILSALQGPPLEDHLQRHTLFPELEKLYGHGYEITCCATSPKHSLIASACRSNSAKHAVIRIFDANKEFQLAEGVLRGHSLTVVSLEFSPCGRYLAAVSRDRQLSLWRFGDSFELVEIKPAHARIVWDCSWGPGVLVTGSRDKTLKAWAVSDNGLELLASVKTASAITSVACFSKEISGRVLVAVGHENGHLALYAVPAVGEVEITEVATFAAAVCPGARVNKLAFSPKTVDGCLQLAVGSEDTSIRVYYVDVRGV